MQLGKSILPNQNGREDDALGPDVVGAADKMVRGIAPGAQCIVGKVETALMLVRILILGDEQHAGGKLVSTAGGYLVRVPLRYAGQTGVTLVINDARFGSRGPRPVGISQTEQLRVHVRTTGRCHIELIIHTATDIVDGSGEVICGNGSAPLVEAQVVITLELRAGTCCTGCKAGPSTRRQRALRRGGRQTFLAGCFVEAVNLDVHRSERLLEAQAERHLVEPTCRIVARRHVYAGRTCLCADSAVGPHLLDAAHAWRVLDTEVKAVILRRQVDDLVVVVLRARLSEPDEWRLGVVCREPQGGAAVEVADACVPAL